MAMHSRFTRIPKVHDLILAGVPTEAIPTYCALADYSNNKTGLCWPRMETLARRLSRSPRTIQRHLHLLEELGLVEFVERYRDRRGRFGAYLYRVVHIIAATARKGVEKAQGRSLRRRGSKKSSTTGHGDLMAPNKGLTKRHEVSPLPPKNDPTTGYWWLFGVDAPDQADIEHRREVEQRRQEEARRRREGYEWFFE
jgi:DNA-binding transcriptional ArsR family regulator